MGAGLGITCGLGGWCGPLTCAWFSWVLVSLPFESWGSAPVGRVGREEPHLLVRPSGFRACLGFKPSLAVTQGLAFSRTQHA